MTKIYVITYKDIPGDYEETRIEFVTTDFNVLCSHIAETWIGRQNAWWSKMDLYVRGNIIVGRNTIDFTRVALGYWEVVLGRQNGELVKTDYFRDIITVSMYINSVDEDTICG